jgi:hypothetical protein
MYGPRGRSVGDCRLHHVVDDSPESDIVVSFVDTTPGTLIDMRMTAKMRLQLNAAAHR